MRAGLALSFATVATLSLAPALAHADGVVVIGGGFRAGFGVGYRGYRNPARIPMPYRVQRFSRPPAGWYGGGYASGSIGIGVQVDSGPSCDYPVPAPPPPPVACCTVAPPVYYPTVVAERPARRNTLSGGARVIAGHTGDSDGRGGDFGGLGAYLRLDAGMNLGVELAVDATGTDDKDRDLERRDLTPQVGLLLFLTGERQQLRPYLSAGAGYTMSKVSIGTSIDTSEDYVGGYAGVGLSARLTRSLRLDVEGRYNRRDKLDRTDDTQILASGSATDKAGTSIPLLPDSEESSELRVGLALVF